MNLAEMRESEARNAEAQFRAQRSNKETEEMEQQVVTKGMGLSKTQELIEFYMKHYGLAKWEAVKAIKADLKEVANY